MKRQETGLRPMPSFTAIVVAILTAVSIATLAAAGPGEQIVRAILVYGAPGNGPAPNFSPKGTQVALTDVAAGTGLPGDAIRPARTGVMQIGPDRTAWIPMLVSAAQSCPQDFCRVYLDRNRNGSFDDDGLPLVATPTQNDKTKAWWSSFSRTTLEIPYPYPRSGGGTTTEPYLVNFWIVREGETLPSVARYSVSSWRTGRVRVNGVEALVAVMDSNNDAVFDSSDTWSVLGADEPDAARRVLSIDEARPMNRLMFVADASGRDVALEFRRISADGRTIEFAAVRRATSKKEDRAPDDLVAAERVRPRTDTPFTWSHGDFDAAAARAKTSGRKILIDFETTWCGPCKTMDQWVWNDAEVAARLNADYVGVKLDGDVEKELVKRFGVAGYPTGVVLDPSGKEIGRFVGYRSSKEILELVGK